MCGLAEMGTSLQKKDQICKFWRPLIWGWPQANGSYGSNRGEGPGLTQKYLILIKVGITISPGCETQVFLRYKSIFDRTKNVFISYRFHYSISETPGYPCQNPFSYGHKVPLSGIDLHHAQLSRHGAFNFSYELGLFLVYLTVLVVCNEIVLGVPFPQI